MISVKESFLSYQGTGLNAGVRQYFVRLSGCTVKCPLRPNCDQPESLSAANGTPTHIDNLVDEALGSVGVGGWLHITGGEPVEHPDIAKLVDRAMSCGLRVQVQTSGSLPINWESSPFVSVSPKQRSIKCVPSEIVLIACDWMTDEFAMKTTLDQRCPVYIVPEATFEQFNSKRSIELASTLHDAGRDARCGLQSHLIWKVR